MLHTGSHNLGIGGRVRGRTSFAVVAVAWLLGGVNQAIAQDVSPPPILQWFESSYQTTINRSADLFMAGYGSVWLPPPGRADLSDFSVGYDVYDRFDLGTWDHKTLYGTETGIKRTADVLHRQGVQLHIDAVINHNGFSDAGTPGFLDAGGYPGFILRNPNGTPTGVPGTDGDFNSAYDYGDLRGRLAGLIDIDHAENYRFIRHPVPGFGPVAGDHGGNLPAGTTPDGAGRLASVPTESNRRYYPDRDGPAIFVFDPTTGEQNIAVYAFNKDNPMAGDPVGENATGYLMRYLQWMVQDVGVDGFRLDAAKHVEGFAFNYLDRAVYRANPRKLLDGSTQHVFSYGEVFDGNRTTLQSYIRKDIDPADPGRIGGNRDVLDFSLYFAMKDNLTGNGLQNDWNNIVDADQDVFDDGLKNGSAGVKFVVSHDDVAPTLGNVAHAYTLMLPGNSVVYFNAKQFGDNRDFPKGGRGDALGGVYGDTLTTLVDIRNTHGRGNYIERWREKELFAYEREGSAVVLLSNRLDSGFDSRTVNVNLPWGTPLVELTGNAKAWNDQVGAADIPEVVQVYNDFFNGPGKIDVRFLRNAGGDRGYLIYGLATPQSDHGVELTNVAQVLQGGTPQANDFSNGNTRLTDLSVINDDSFQVKLATKAVNLLGSIRDADADGDNALLKINDGLNINGNSGVDFTTPAPGSVTYGFEQFTTTRQPGYGSANGNGLYIQNIDASQLPEGVNFITVRAFRHRGDGGPAVFSDFKKVVYIDRLAPISAPAGFKPFSGGDGNNDILIESVDFTADSVHLFLNLPAALTDQQVLQMALNGDGHMDRVDVNLFKQGFFGVPNGHNVFSIVTFEITGTFNVQRYVGLTPTSAKGAGLGDLTLDNQYEGNDLDLMVAAIQSGDTLFHAPADFTADGRVTLADWHQLGDKLLAIHTAGTLRPDGFPLVSQGTIDYYNHLTTTIPEPGTLLLLLTLLPTLGRRPRCDRKA